jgi:hypothetical protein
MNPLYRAGEILKPAAQTVESLIKIFADPIFSPIKTIFHPISYMKKNVLGLATGTANTITNTIKAPVILANEAYKTIFDHNIEALAQSTATISIAKTITATSSKIAKTLGWIIKGPAKALDYITQPIDVSQAWVQAAA